MNALNWIIENLNGLITVVPTVILGLFYYKLNKRQKAAEVKQAEVNVQQTEVNVKQTEGDALSTMQNTYKTFVEDYQKEYNELKDDIKTLMKTDQQKDFVISDLQRKTDGLTTVVGGLKQALSEVEKIACVKLECKIREPKLGEYKHKREA